MQFRETKTYGVIKCPCGHEITKGEIAYVPVVKDTNGNTRFLRPLCKDCKDDPDGAISKYQKLIEKGVKQ